MIGVILVSSLLMCIEGEFSDVPEKYSQYVRHLEFVMEPVDFFLLLIFLMEIALKWADDFPGFWNEPWNLFDLVVTCASLFTPIFDVTFPDSHEDESLEYLVSTIKYIRIARILRTLNVVTRLKKIMIIWGAITRTFGPLAFITVLMLLFFYIFAIIGITMCDRFTKTHITNLYYVHRFENLGFACLTLFQIFTIDHWFPILTELMQVMDARVACVYILTWLLLGTFIFKNIFAGVMVNNFQNIREELVNETYEISNKSKLFRDFDVQIDALQQEILKTPDSKKDWETRVFHLLDLIKASQGELSPSLWPRDTLFHYYVILEALGNNISERDELLNILNEALLHHYN
ncbi:unnamed protein product [Allacma fusca]|nr:unnamed protein product [Allacma fusca]